MLVTESRGLEGLERLFDAGDDDEEQLTKQPPAEQPAGVIQRRTFADGPGVVPRAEHELQRRDEALRLRLGGYTYRQIAEAMGISPTAVSNLITRALEQAPNEKAIQQRAIENARLDRLQAAVWSDAIKGDVNAIDAVLRISRRRAEMNGLDAPKKIDIRASVRHDVSRAVAELQEVLLGDVIEVDQNGLRLVDQINAISIPAGSDGLPLEAGEPG